MKFSRDYVWRAVSEELVEAFTMSANFTEIFSDLRLFTPLSLEKVEEKKNLSNSELY